MSNKALAKSLQTASHTPGPWLCQPIGDETECNVLGAGRELIATVSDNDARLIAAAPELLDLAKQLVSTPLHPEAIERLIEHAFVLIDKAEDY